MSSLQIPASHHGHHVHAHDVDQVAEGQQQSVAHSSKTPVIAERFKTKQCRNYLQQGSCPYEARCMFAHGAEELRTKEMNVADGLTTEEAVKQFQRRRLHANGQRGGLDGMHHHAAHHHQGAHHLVGHNNPYEYYGYGSQQMYGAYGGMYPALETHYEPAKYTPVPFGLPEELVPATPVATTAAPKESAFEAAAPVAAPKPKISSDLINLFAPAAVVEAP